jgi:hypothetical protein
MLNETTVISYHIPLESSWSLNISKGVSFYNKIISVLPYLPISISLVSPFFLSLGIFILSFDLWDDHLSNNLIFEL